MTFGSMDIYLLVIIIACLVVGFFWGAARSIMLLGAWLLAFVSGAYLKLELGSYLASRWTNFSPSFADMAAFGIIYVGILLMAPILIVASTTGDQRVSRIQALDDLVGAIFFMLVAILGIAGVIIVLSLFYGTESVPAQVTGGPEWTANLYAALARLHDRRCHQGADRAAPGLPAGADPSGRRARGHGLTLAALRAGDVPSQPPRSLTPTPIDSHVLDGQADEVACRLLGVLLVRDDDLGRRIARIVETEAYAGPGDLASHARAGRTPRTEVMFGPPGRAYVYLVYGMHHCLNVVCAPDGQASAVLIRAVEPLTGVERMRERRGPSGGADHRLGAGPARACQALDIDRRLDGIDLLADARLWLAAPSDGAAPLIVSGPRIGVDYAGPEWSARPWRFGIAGHPSLSRPFPKLMDGRSAELLELPLVRERLAAYAAFGPSRRLALALEPSADPIVVTRRLDETDEARWLLSTRPDIGIGGARDIGPIVARAARGGRLDPGELWPWRRRSWRPAAWPTASARPSARCSTASTAASTPLPALRARLEASVDPAGEILDSASPTLGGLRRAVRIAHERLRTRLESLIRSELGDALQESLVTMRAGRYVVPVRAEAQSRVKGIVHDRSASGQTLFIEPLIAVDLSNAWREAQLAVQAEEERVLDELSGHVGVAAEALSADLDVLARFDLWMCKARLADEMRAVRAEAATSTRVMLRAARHPGLSGDVVPVDVVLGDEYTALVITGPNTGGKTVALRTVGLLALMHQSGLHVPAAPGSVLPVFRDVLADIGDEQSVAQSLSTFSGHLRTITRIVEAAGEGSLVLLDELGAGTDPTEGSALAQALLDHFIRAGALVVATTHYAELKTYAHNEPRARNASVDFDLAHPGTHVPPLDRPARHEPGVRHRGAPGTARLARRGCSLTAVSGAARVRIHARLDPRQPALHGRCRGACGRGRGAGQGGAGRGGGGTAPGEGRAACRRRGRRGARRRWRWPPSRPRSPRCAARWRARR